MNNLATFSPDMATAQPARALAVTAMKVGMGGRVMGEWEQAMEEVTEVEKWEEV